MMWAASGLADCVMVMVITFSPQRMVTLAERSASLSFSVRRIGILTLPALPDGTVMVIQLTDLSTEAVHSAVALKEMEDSTSL